MYTLLSSISTVSKILLLGSEPDLSVFSEKLLFETEISENIQSQILDNAQRNNLLPLLYKNLKKHPTISALFIDEMKQHVLKISFQQLKQEAVFRELHKNLTEDSKDYRVLKGFYLARKVYPEVFLRPMIDIDILVRPNQIKDIFELLQSKGFVSYPVAEHKFISNQKHHPYGLKYKGVAIELHRSIFSDYDPVRIEESILWDNPTEFSFPEIKAKTLSNEVFLFHLCHHLMGHLRGDSIKLIWCRDIAEFVKVFNNKINWDYFIQLYRQSGANEELLHGLWFAHDWMNAEVPEKVLSRIKTPAIDIVNEFILFTENKRNNSPRPHLINKFRHVKGWKNRGSFLLMKLFPEPNFILLKYRKKKKIHLLYSYPHYVGNFLMRGVKALFAKVKR